MEQKQTDLFASMFYIVYLNIRMQVVIQVFFMALCNNIDQHSVHTEKNPITYCKTIELNNGKVKMYYTVCFIPVVLML